MIWATTPEVRAYAGADLPSSVGDAEVQRGIDRAVRSLEASVLRWPLLDDAERPADARVRADVVAAVAETLLARRKADAVAADLGGAGATAVIAAGGTVSAGKLTVSGSRNGGSGAGVAIGDAGRRPPVEAWEALAAAGMIGGSVASW
ncbi:hypothetical protein [Actinosynnema mirum]|uniref:Uncharacterized protein n=1 Tax=Actinosynnema mirum (strain ATCC 29888 / DSM 43827 / JCM 3225 / NBRC 14064 / NCIMB 13271 / NRRL B-12336 / IMRU 3971 / 101) TaxID=446462 RepID=C6WBL9_ACTMD|nr:hypothetical protein [Actinosynnema mirum]ACU35587.1 hypothetical protein Amir_1638 [Actinosynnema mirum DSM 43827]